MDYKVNLMSTVEGFKLDTGEAAPGSHWSTRSGAEFIVGEEGVVTITKSNGCFGCDMCFTKVTLDGKPAHMVNDTDAILCTKPTDISTGAVN